MASTETVVQDYARKYLHNYKIRESPNGTEYVAEYCPICGGGSGNHRDKWTFAINSNGAANCMRANDCGFRGNINDLLKMEGEKPIKFGKRMQRVNLPSRPHKIYALPETETQNLTEECRNYLHTRGFSDKTIEAFKLCSDMKGNIVFNFYRDGKLVYQKFRAPRKFTKESKGMKEWQSPNCEPILFNMDGLSFNNPVIITEGQCDCMALYEAGFKNVTSVPCGAQNLDWIDNCFDFIRNVKQWIIFGDSDSAGQQLVDTLKKRLSMCDVWYVPASAYPQTETGHICKDANEIFHRFGLEGIMKCLDQAVETKVEGLIAFKDIPDEDPIAQHRFPFGIPAIDAVIHGFRDGDLTIITGDTGCGKSTTMGIAIINAIEHGEKVCCYSGELTKTQFKEWLTLQAAGEDYVGLTNDPFLNEYDKSIDNRVPHVDKQARERINEWFGDRLYLYNNEDYENESVVDSVVSIFQAAAQRYGCKFFMVDNLMSLSFGEDGDDNSIQGRMISKMKNFAMVYGVHVFIVAHLRKVSTFGRKEITYHDISGNSMTAKAATNIILVDNQTFRILKNRGYASKKVIRFCYCPASRRVYQEDLGDKLICSWNKEGIPFPSVKANSLPQFYVVLPPTDDPI